MLKQFWHSPTHAAHLRMTGRRTFSVEHDGRIHHYTAISRPESHEPFLDGLKNYPDYRKVCLATVDNIKVA